MVVSIEECWDGHVKQLQNARAWMAAFGFALLAACSVGCADDNAGHTKGGIDEPVASTGSVEVQPDTKKAKEKPPEKASDQHKDVKEAPDKKSVIKPAK